MILNRIVLNLEERGKLIATNNNNYIIYKAADKGGGFVFIKIVSSSHSLNSSF